MQPVPRLIEVSDAIQHLFDRTFIGAVTALVNAIRVGGVIGTDAVVGYGDFLMPVDQAVADIMDGHHGRGGVQ